MNARLEQEFADELERLDAEERARVMDYLRSRRSALPQGVPGSALLRFSGTISEGTLRRMEQVIEEEFEQIDDEGW